MLEVIYFIALASIAYFHCSFLLSITELPLLVVYGELETHCFLNFNYSSF